MMTSARRGLGTPRIFSSQNCQMASKSAVCVPGFFTPSIAFRSRSRLRVKSCRSLTSSSKVTKAPQSLRVRVTVSKKFMAASFSNPSLPAVELEVSIRTPM